MDYFPYESMPALQDALTDAYKETVALNFSTEGGQLFLGNTVIPYIFGLNTTMVLTEASVQEIAEAVYTNELWITFVEELTFRFFTYAGLTPEVFEGLCSNIARAGSTQSWSNTTIKSAIPTQYQKRQASFNDAVRRLVSNPWLVVMLLVRLFGVSKIDVNPPKNRPSAR